MSTEEAREQMCRLRKHLLGWGLGLPLCAHPHTRGWGEGGGGAQLLGNASNMNFWNMTHIPIVTPASASCFPSGRAESAKGTGDEEVTIFICRLIKLMQVWPLSGEPSVLRRLPAAWEGNSCARRCKTHVCFMVCDNRLSPHHASLGHCNSSNIRLSPFVYSALLTLPGCHLLHHHQPFLN